MSFLTAKIKLIHFDLHEIPIKKIASPTKEQYLLHHEYFNVSKISPYFSITTHIMYEQYEAFFKINWLHQNIMYNITCIIQM